LKEGQIGLPPVITPDDRGMNRRSTRQLLKKIPGFPCLYRHDVNEIYYGITKVLGNRKEHELVLAWVCQIIRNVPFGVCSSASFGGLGSTRS